MSIVEEVETVVAQGDAEREASADLRRLMAFYEEMQRQGLVRKQEYNLPLIDTIGRSPRLWRRTPSAD